MPLFRKKPDAHIPPVPSPVSSSLSIDSRSLSSSSSITLGGDALASGYNGNRGPRDVYSRGTARLDEDRAELFSGYNPTKSGSGRFFDGPDLATGKGEEGGDDDVEAIKQQTRFVKQESVNSTRNALRLAREAEETGRNTLARLGEQSEKLANTERLLDVSKGHSQRAADNADELKQLNRSIFRPVIKFNKKGKHAAREAEIQERYDEQMRNRDEVAKRSLQTQSHIEGAGSEELLGNRSGLTAEQSARVEQRGRFQFERTDSDDELEDEIDDNLNQIGEAAKKLHGLTRAMGTELDHQNKWIDGIAGKTERLDDGLRLNTERLNRIK